MQQTFWETIPHICSYDSNWPIRYEFEKKELIKLLGPRITRI